MKASWKYIFRSFITICIMSFKMPMSIKHVVTFFTLKFVGNLGIVCYVTQMIFIIVQIHYIFTFQKDSYSKFTEVDEFRDRIIIFTLKHCSSLFISSMVTPLKFPMELLGISEQLLYPLH